ncbi:hypothetical protein OPU71_18400 [Niveibacterium sp. 24ML]|uniref:PFGI-1 class ICE element type IV pilus protein PilL2 n=1 Tax=Niveibacterium sp. 24ML TaxID=2985512 RepID=UPI00226EDA1D|nr:hypothetical protein [Niveibacterium sp. 24ML]MCX9158097.1 hypothetical protein [Niveibacterium sp. 24ML]
MRRFLPIALLVLHAPAFAGGQPEQDALRVSRYTSVAATPSASERDPLRAVIKVSFPRPEVRTVADAIAYILPRTGYRFAPNAVGNPQFAELLRQPLPESHRTLGPYTVLAVLQTLAGEGYVLSAEAASRRIHVSEVQPEGAAPAQALPLASSLTAPSPALISETPLPASEKAAQ